MATSSWLSDLAGFSAAADQPPTCDVWLFGSALYRGRPPDLDVLIVYQDGSVADALAFRSRLAARGREADWPPFDFVTLSVAEEESVKFAIAEGAERVGHQAPSAS